MSYLSSKKIYPGNWNEPLNGWYKNIDTDDSGANDHSKGGPTSVLATPGYRYFQVRGYVPVTATSGSPAASGEVIIPSPTGTMTRVLTSPALWSVVPAPNLPTSIAPPSPLPLAGVTIALLPASMPPLVT